MVVAILVSCLATGCAADVSGRNDLGRRIRVSGSCANAEAVDLGPGDTGTNSFVAGDACEVYDGDTYEFLGCLVLPGDAQDFLISRYFVANRTERSCDS